MTAPPRVAVVGAGIVCSAIALALARRGARVDLVDAGAELVAGEVLEGPESSLLAPFRPDRPMA